MIKLATGIGGLSSWRLCWLVTKCCVIVWPRFLQAERRLLEDKRRQEEVAYLKHQAKHLDLFLKAMPKM